MHFSRGIYGGAALWRHCARSTSRFGARIPPPVLASSRSPSCSCNRKARPPSIVLSHTALRSSPALARTPPPVFGEEAIFFSTPSLAPKLRSVLLDKIKSQARLPAQLLDCEIHLVHGSAPTKRTLIHLSPLSSSWPHLRTLDQPWIPAEALYPSANLSQTSTTSKLASHLSAGRLCAQQRCDCLLACCLTMSQLPSVRRR